MLASLLLLGTLCPQVADDQKEKAVQIDLGGIRQAKAFVIVAKHDYFIRIEMVPISLFDKATNELVNLEKARELALIALAKHLSPKEAVELTVSGAENEKIVAEAKKYSLTVRVPTNGVRVVKGDEKPAKGKEKAKDRIVITSGSSLFTRKGDYENLIQGLGTFARAELTKAESEKMEEKFDEAVSKIKQRGLGNFDKVDQAIGADLLLFSKEQSELRQAVSKERQSLVSKVEETVKNYKKKLQEKENLP